MTALTYPFCAEPCVKNSPPQNLEYYPKCLGDMLKKTQTYGNFDFITLFLRKFLLILGKIFRFWEELCFSPETELRIDTPIN